MYLQTKNTHKNLLEKPTIVQQVTTWNRWRSCDPPDAAIYQLRMTWFIYIYTYMHFLIYIWYISYANFGDMDRAGENRNIFIYSSIFSEEQRGIWEKGIKGAKFLLQAETCCDRCVTCCYSELASTASHRNKKYYTSGSYSERGVVSKLTPHFEKVLLEGKSVHYMT